jgi:hypothetical protein
VLEGAAGFCFIRKTEAASSALARAEPIEHATNGDVMFVRWIARGTGPKGSFEAVGVDRIIAPNGYVAENLIISDHPIFADFARHVGDLRGA